jgi:hypothetical protein
MTRPPGNIPSLGLHREEVEAAEIDGGLRDVRGLVLRNKDCLRSTPLHKKKTRSLGAVAH